MIFLSTEDTPEGAGRFKGKKGLKESILVMSEIDGVLVLYLIKPPLNLGWAMVIIWDWKLNKLTMARGLGVRPNPKDIGIMGRGFVSLLDWKPAVVETLEVAGSGTSLLLPLSPFYFFSPYSPLLLVLLLVWSILLSAFTEPFSAFSFNLAARRLDPRRLWVSVWLSVVSEAWPA
jgi:hypothetical protein